MKLKIALFIVIGSLVLSACNNKKSEAENPNTEQNSTVDTEREASSSEIDWSKVPELAQIGDFPFITAPEGIDIYDFPENSNPKDGITDLFPFKKFEVYNGTGTTPVEGKIAVLFFMEDTSNGFKYDQYIFNRNFKDYFQKIGAKQLYQGNFPDNEEIRSRLKENMFSGKSQTHGILDDSPLSVYAFKNKGKKYIINVQSNSAQATIFVVELKDFEQSITAYKASDIQNELENKGKTVLYINFDTDKATLTSDGKQVIEEINKVLHSSPEMKISIEGHTDDSGSSEHNKTLSLQRAQAVENVLLSNGIDKARLQAKGFGAENQFQPTTVMQIREKTAEWNLSNYKIIFSVNIRKSQMSGLSFRSYALSNCSFWD